MTNHSTQHTARKEIKPASIVINGLFAHYDKVEIAVKLTRENAHRWYVHHRSITDMIAESIGGEIGRPRRKDARGYQWTRMITSSDVEIEISSPKTNRKDGADEETVLKNQQVLSRFRITSRNKSDYESHLKALHGLNETLKTFGIEHHVSVVEIAVDSRDEDLMVEFSRSAHLHRARIKGKIFNHADGGKHRKCPSEEGKDQYVGYRRQSRQLHSYYKPECGIWRTEVILFRPNLKLESLRIGTLDDLLKPGTMKALLEKNIRFMTPNLRKIYRDHPGTRKLKLESMTVDGVMDILMQYHECKKNDINKYFVRTDGPAINYMPLSISFDQFTQQNQIHNKSVLEAISPDIPPTPEPEEKPARKPIFEKMAYDISMIKVEEREESEGQQGERICGWDEEMERLSRECYGRPRPMESSLNGVDMLPLN